MATLSDVARRAGVSVSVASRALNDAPGARIRTETRESVRQAALELDYAPNHAGRGLRLGRTGSIGLLVPNVTDAFFGELLRGVEDAADELGLVVLLGRSERLDQHPDYLRRLVREGRLDGFLLQLTDASAAGDLVDYIGANLPLVLINARGARAGSVVLDDPAGIDLATTHLIELGHTEIGFLGGLPTSFTGRQRRLGFVRAMERAGLGVDASLVREFGYRPDDGRAAIRALWADGARPTGLVVANPNAALGALAELRTLGVAVPADLSLVALHEAPASELAAPPLTTVGMPLHELGRRAVAELTARLAGETARDVTVAEPAPVLHRRESAGPPRGR